MARKPRTRKPKEPKIHEVEDETPQIAHNQPELTDDERRALMLIHKKNYTFALAAKKAAATAFLGVCKKAKAECGENAVDDIKDALAFEAPGGQLAFEAEMARKHKVARWMNLPVGSMPTFFEVTDRRPAEDRSYDDGKISGMAGEVCKPPEHTADSQKWIAGWQDGQAVLASAFSKTKVAEEPADDPLPSDTTAADMPDAPAMPA